MTDTQAAPCPFCGGPGEYRNVQDWHGVGCETRHCPGQRSALHHRSAAAAFAAWNRRAPISQPELAAAQVAAMRERAERAEAACARHEELAEKIEQWAQAYPLDIFHEPSAAEFKRAHEALQAVGLNGIDAFCASSMRRVITQVAAMVRDARATQAGGEPRSAMPAETKEMW